MLKRPVVPAGRSAAVVLTSPDLNEVVRDLESITIGADAVELRVDLFKDTSAEFVAAQIAVIRKHADLPIIYTVRTMSQGGKFPDENVDELKSLLLLGIRLGVAYVDLQLTAPNELIEEISSKKGFTRVIGTYQDINGELKWNNVEWKTNIIKVFP